MPKSAKNDVRKTRFVVQAFDEIQGVLQRVISEMASGTIVVVVVVVVVVTLPYVLCCCHATSLDEALQKPWHTFVCLFTMIQSQDPR